MNIKSHAFRLTITVIAFVMGFSVYRCFDKVEQFSTSAWFGTIKRFIPFQSGDEGPRSSRCGQAALCSLTGEYYLSEDRLPIGFTDFGHLELLDGGGEDGSWPQAGVRTPSTGTVYADKAYRIRKISTSLDAVTFETEVNNGISYRFTGRVRQTDERDGSSHESRTGDIIGKLEKLRNGTVVASMESTFYLFGR